MQSGKTVGRCEVFGKCTQEFQGQAQLEISAVPAGLTGLHANTAQISKELHHETAERAGKVATLRESVKLQLSNEMGQSNVQGKRRREFQGISQLETSAIQAETPGLQAKAAQLSSAFHFEDKHRLSNIGSIVDQVRTGFSTEVEQPEVLERRTQEFQDKAQLELDDSGKSDTAAKERLVALEVGMATPLSHQTMMDERVANLKGDLDLSCSTAAYEQNASDERSSVLSQAMQELHRELREISLALQATADVERPQQFATTADVDETQQENAEQRRKRMRRLNHFMLRVRPNMRDEISMVRCGTCHRKTRCAIKCNLCSNRMNARQRFCNEQCWRIAHNRDTNLMLWLPGAGTLSRGTPNR